MTNIAVFGANGTIGSAIVREALDRGHTVTAVVRDLAKVTERHPHLTVTTGNVLDAQSVTAAANGREPSSAPWAAATGPATSPPSSPPRSPSPKDCEPSANRLPA